jgi:CheY-like chemotaxis protein
MEAIGQLAGGIAHDFNNILTVIIGFSTLIGMEMDKDDPQKTNLNNVLAAADRAADLTRSLLTFSRKQDINLQSVNLNQIIRKIGKFLKRIIGEDIELKITFRQECVTVNADSGQIEQVLMNLATNARDAMPEGGLLSIETDTVELDDEYIEANGYGQPGRYACIAITDSGDGMDEITCKKVFEPFFTTKEVGRGTGLGLSIVFGIIKQHLGFINVYSEPGEGTTFKILLPITTSAAVEKYISEEKVLEKGVETILVADDDASIRELIEKSLGMFGYTVIMAVDGNDALDKFKENKDRIDLVIMDIIMPKMSSKDAFDKMKKINPAVKAIFISGYTSDIIQKRGLLEQGLEFVPKPLNLKQLLNKVRNVLNGEA